jgi:3-methyladenine DNA glycosylase Tag
MDLRKSSPDAKPAIIRKRLKIEATKTNAVAFLQVQERIGEFRPLHLVFYSWQNHDPQWKELRNPHPTAFSQENSKDLKIKDFDL